MNSRMTKAESINVGDEITVSEFSVDDVIDVTGTSIGKGFRVIKRNFRVVVHLMDRVFIERLAPSQHLQLHRA